MRVVSGTFKMPASAMDMIFGIGFIPDWVNANSFGFFAITEPNSGSDVAGMGTTAVDCGDHWEITGQKMWISNAQIGDWGLVYAFTDKTKKYKGMTCFIVNLKDNEGIITAPIEVDIHVVRGVWDPHHVR